MQNYEATLVLANDLAEETLNGILQGISAFIQEKGGLLEKQIVKRSRRGILAVLSFSLRQDEVENVSKKIKEEKGVMRFMITLAMRQRTTAPALRTFTPEKAYAKAKAAEPEQKMSAEDIDKKLAEIFKENGSQ